MQLDKYSKIIGCGPETDLELKHLFCHVEFSSYLFQST